MELNGKAPGWDSEGLDLDVVARVARNEVRRLTSAPASRAEAAEATLAQYYLGLYDDAGPDIADEIFAEAFGQARLRWGGEAPVTPEFICGRAMAVVALGHAKADLDLTADHFRERATECLADYELAPGDRELADVGADRLLGCDLDEPIRSAQSLTGREVKEALADRKWGFLDLDEAEDRAVALSLTDEDCCELARYLMEEYVGLGIDGQDVEDIACRARERARERPGFEEEVASCREQIERERQGCLDDCPRSLAETAEKA